MTLVERRNAAPDRSDSRRRVAPCVSLGRIPVTAGLNTDPYQRAEAATG